MTGTPPVSSAGTLIALLAYPGVDELDLFGGYALLAKAGSIAEESGAPPITAVITAEDPEIHGSGGVTFRAQEELSVLERAHAVVVPGGRGAAAAAEAPQLRRLLRQVDDRNARLYSVCSGALVLAGAGLTEGRTLAIHAAKRSQLTERGAARAVSGLLHDGRICSVGGDVRDSVKSVDLAFALLADLRPELIDPVTRRTEISPGRAAQQALQASSA